MYEPPLLERNTCQRIFVVVVVVCLVVLLLFLAIISTTVAATTTPPKIHSSCSSLHRTEAIGMDLPKKDGVKAEPGCRKSSSHDLVG
jgi:hypothetical protein